MASITNAKVSFKTGLQTKLPAQSTSGTFYYTTDTNRFFLGLDDGEYAQIGKDVVALVDTSEGLTDLKDAAKDGDLVYVKDINVLCIYDGSKFMQVNPDTDTYVKTLTASIEGRKVTITATMNRDPGDGTDTTRVATFNLPEQVTPTVGLTSGDGTGGVTITPKGTGITVGTPVTIKGSGAVNVTQAADVITIEGTDTDTKVTSGTLAFNSDNVELTLKQNDIADVKIDDQGAIKGAITTAVEAMQSELDDVIKEQLKDLNSMTYKGTVGTAGTVTALPSESVAVGDVYMADGTVTALGDEEDVKAGDLFIATGTEDADGFITGDVKWTCVPSGKDTDTHYTLAGAANAITLTGTPGGAAGSITVADDDIVVATVADNTLKVTHKDYEQPTSEDGDAETPGFGGSF